MPSRSKAQQRFMGAELARQRAGKRPRTALTAEQVEDFASTKHPGLPARTKGARLKRAMGGRA